MSSPSDWLSIDVDVDSNLSADCDLLLNVSKYSLTCRTPWPSRMRVFVAVVASELSSLLVDVRCFVVAVDVAAAAAAAAATLFFFFFFFASSGVTTWRLLIHVIGIKSSSSSPLFLPVSLVLSLFSLNLTL